MYLIHITHDILLAEQLALATRRATCSSVTICLQKAAMMSCCIAQLSAMRFEFSE